MDAAAHPVLSWLQTWIETYPGLSYFFIFLTAFLESLLLVGMPLPGAALIISFGALIALGYLDFSTTVLLCIAGAVAGDGLSFWIGYHYKDKLKKIWPFYHFKNQFKSGEQFFLKHGGKSIAFGRFVGPVRAIIPTIAGMMNMSPWRFTVINVLSAIAWAPAYLLPGMVFGASVDLASEVAIRLVVFIFVLIILIFLIRWLIRKVILYIQPHASSWVARSTNWASRHPLFKPVVGSLVDPRQPESRALVVLALLLIFSGVVFFIILNNLSTGMAIDQTVYELMTSLRTPGMDTVMVTITMLADTPVIIVVTALMLLWLLYKKNIPAALHMVAAVAFGAILTRVLKASLHIPRPDPGLFSGTSAYSFPSAHSTLAMVLYGFIAIIIGRELSARWRMHVYVSAGILITLIAFSRLYLGAHWLSDVIGGLTSGLVWISLLGIAYRRHPSPSLPTATLFMVSLGSLILVATLHWQFNFTHELARYNNSHKTETTRLAHWQEVEWQQLPAYRQDLANSSQYPFNMQWAETLDTIQLQLEKLNWIKANPISASGLLKWMSQQTPLSQRPVLPQIHNGHHESLAMTYTNTETGQLFIIRFWSSNKSTDTKPIWLVQLSTLKTRSFLKLFYYPVTDKHFTDSQKQLLSQFEINFLTALKTRKSSLLKTWDGTVILVQSRR